MNPQSSDLSPVQVKVIAALAAGQSVSDAARTAGVHRSTIHNWLSDPLFRSEYDRIRQDFALELYDEVIGLQRLALATIRQLLESPDASPSVKLRAALAILNRPAPKPAPQPEEAPEHEGEPSHPVPDYTIRRSEPAYTPVPPVEMLPKNPSAPVIRPCP